MVPERYRAAYEIALQQKVGWWWAHEAPGARCAVAYLLSDDADPEELRDALVATARRHEIFATVYEISDGMRIPSQVVTGTPMIDALVVTLDGAGLAEATVAELVSEAASEPFDLAAGPVLSVRVVASGRDRLLIVTAPALAADERSLHDLVAAALGGLAGVPNAVDEDAVQYSDYAGWQIEMFEEHGAPTALAAQETTDQTPADVARWLAVARHPAGAREPRAVRVEVTPEQAAAVRRLADSLGVDEASVLFGCWIALLGALGGGERFPVGLFHDGRVDEELIGAAGPFDVCVPLAVDVPEDATLAEAIRWSAAALRRSREEVDASTARLDAGLRSLGPVESSVPTFHHIRLAAPRGHAAVPCHSGRPALLNLSLVSGEHGLGGTLTYDAGRFDDETAAGIARQFALLLTAALAAPETPFGASGFVDEAESARAGELSARLTRRVPVPDVAPIALFRAVAARWPERVAVVAGDEELSFAELADRADALAIELRRRGVGAGDAVMIALERTTRMVVAVLAIWRAGATYVPLDLTTPRPRLETLIEVARPALMVTERQLHERFGTDSCAQLFIDDLDDDVDDGLDDAAKIAAPDEALVSDPELDSAAYVIFTSGSTGVPKGVVVSHRSVTALLVGLRADVYADAPPGEPLRVAVNGPLSFDTTVKQLIQLCDGRRVCLVPADLRYETEQLLGYLRRHRVDVLDCTPSVLRAWIEGGLLDASRSGLRHVLIGGEAIPPDLWEEIQRDATVRCTNLYGPTECTVDVATSPVTGGPPWVSVGRALPNVEVTVRDERGRPLPPGFLGELHVSGPTVALGYLGDEELTRQSFDTDDAGVRRYRTGDLARLRPDGSVDLVGRRDRQRKIRGYRVELGEVEATLRRHPAVSTAAVTELTAASGAEQLVAYVAGEPGQRVDADDVRAWIANTVIHYMQPSIVVALDAMPLTTNGKIDYRALPAPTETSTEDDRPRGGVEEALADTWREVLSLASVGRSEDFFALGGDSILCIQVVAKAKRRGLPLKPNDLFRARTIADLGALVERERRARPSQDAAVPAGVEVELTPIQRRFFERGLANVHHWNQSVALRFEADVTSDEVRQAFDAVVAHHDAFRLRFTRRADGSWTQTYTEGAGVGSFETIELRGLTDGEAERAVAAAAHRSQTGLDIGHGPLVAAALVLVDGRPQRLLIVAHHLVMDGVSWQIIITELADTLRRGHRGEQPDLGAPTAPYAAWSRALAAYGRRPDTRRQVEHWAGIDARVPAPLPRDHAEGGNVIASAEDLVTVVDRATTGRLLDLAARTPGGLVAVLLAGLGRAVREWSGHREIDIDVETHGREAAVDGEVDVSGTVGWFTALWPVVIGTDDDGDARVDLRLAAEAIGAVPDNGVGYGVLRYLTGDQPAWPVAGRREIAFSYMGQVDRSIAGDSRVRLVEEPVGADFAPEAERAHLLELYCGVVGGELTSYWTFSREVHERDTVAALNDRYVAALTRLSAEIGDGAR
jgi:amino acid adenylation domain-containing protein/non-ribosomal peptide synthase protein (TIGR01720 family)